uniref:NACHT domain-containing protein n=1 Tax=Amphimedon queenslandica TaxID=400682 RepID=A0A1X7TAF6_AMPQE
MHASSSTSPIDEYALQLRDQYDENLTRYKDPNINKFPAAGELDFPYVPFIPLISIMVEKHRKKDAEFFKKASVEQILEKFEKIEIDSILKPLVDKRLRFVLIEGEPGIGKSTLAKELTLRWVRQTDKYLNNFRVVIFITLRLEINQKAKTFEDLLIFVENMNMTEIALLIKRARGAGVLWILDGFDELPHHLRNSSTSIFIKLIRGDILSKSTVIVTSRHAATDPLRTYLEDDSKLIALKGFGSNETMQYASKYFKNEKVTSEFRSYYSRNSMIESMLHNPMNCFIMCTIFKSFIIDNDKEQVITFTEIYNHYVRVLLKRHLIDANLTNLTNITYEMPSHLIQKIDFNYPELSDFWKDFYYLSRMAYVGVMKQEYVFGKELRGVSKLSMMDTITSFSGFDKDESSSFIHTTLQEYLAAIYIANNPDSIFTREDLQQNSNLEVVLTFYVGLLKLIDRKVDYRTMNLIFNHSKNIFDSNLINTVYIDNAFKSYHYPDYNRFLKIVYHDLSDEIPYFVLTSLMLRCIYEQDSLLYSTAFLDKKYKFARSTQFHPERSRAIQNLDYFICGYIVAGHNITIKLEFYTLSDVIAFKKGLQFHSPNAKINGKIKIQVDSDCIQSILTQLLAVHGNMVIGLHLKSLDNVSICQMISKFPSLELINLDSFDSNYCSSHPLLQLKTLKKLTLRIKNVCETVVNLLIPLTNHGRPLKQLRICVESVDTVKSIQILKLIEMQFSLEDLRIDVSHNMKFLWHKRNNSLTVNRNEFLTEELLAIVSKIQLNSYTSFIDTNDVNGMLRTLEITIHSKKVSTLGDFVTIFKRNTYTSEGTIRSICILRTKEIFSGSFIKVPINDLMDATISPFITDQNLIFYCFYCW